MNQEVDVSASGVSFIDILFALVVTVILDPVQSWARNPDKNHLPAGTITHLVVALVLVLTSWIGYHNSANKPQFKIKFFNYELAKFSLDICMVVVYFLVASVATRRPLGNRQEVVLVATAFTLYLLWDIAGYAQRKPGSNYQAAWEVERALTPEIGQWKSRRPSRILVTALFLCLSLIVLWPAFAAPSGSFKSVVVLDGILIAILVGYRFTKDHVAVS